MSWANLLFLHWPVDSAALRPLIPAETEIDTFDNRAWVGLIPFQMVDCSFHGLPRLRALHTFYECNVRTYVRHRGLPGVWFFSLDAQHLLPVLGGRWRWSLNYVHSRFTVVQPNGSGGDVGRIDYGLVRRAGPWPRATSHIAWRTGECHPPAAPGSLPHFLTERYHLFTKRFGRILAGQVDHEPWPLCEAHVEALDDSLVAAAGIHVSGPPLAFASHRTVNVRAWPLGRVASASRRCTPLSGV